MQADFSGNSNIEFYSEIQKQVSKIENNIGLVILNAGVGKDGPFSEVCATETQVELDTNVYHVALMAKKMLAGLEARNSRSGLITVSSIASYIPIPGLISYSATKSFVTFFTQAL